MKKSTSVFTRVNKYLFNLWLKVSCYGSAFIIIMLIITTNFLPKNVFEKISILLFFLSIGSIYILSYPYRFLKKIKEKPIEIYIHPQKIQSIDPRLPFSIDIDAIKSAQYINSKWITGYLIEISSSTVKQNSLFKLWASLFCKLSNKHIFIPCIQQNKLHFGEKILK